jgi:hypothetical protein
MKTARTGAAIAMASAVAWAVVALLGTPTVASVPTQEFTPAPSLPGPMRPPHYGQPTPTVTPPPGGQDDHNPLCPAC